jgi:DNA polymerase-3 subunit delta'
MGKLQFAEALVQSLVCTEPGADGLACGLCRACRLAAAGTHPDLSRVAPEADSAQIKIDQIRDLVDWVTLSRQFGGYKAVLLHPAEAMNRAAANSLLKTLEEPARMCVFVLVSHQPGALPATVRSRCQYIAFSAERELVLGWLRARLANPDLAPTLLELADGSPMRALEFGSSGYVDDWVAVATDLAQLQQGRRMPLAVAGSWTARGARRVLPILEALSRTALGWRLGAGAHTRPALEGAEDLHAFANALDLRLLVRFHSKILEFMGILNQITGLRESSLLEDLATFVAPSGGPPTARRR